MSGSIIRIWILSALMMLGLGLTTKAQDMEELKPAKIFRTKYVPFGMSVHPTYDERGLLNSRIEMGPLSRLDVKRIVDWLDKKHVSGKVDASDLCLFFEPTKGKRYLVDSEGRLGNPYGQEYYIKPSAFLNLSITLDRVVKL